MRCLHFCQLCVCHFQVSAGKNLRPCNKLTMKVRNDGDAEFFFLGGGGEGRGGEGVGD